MTVTRKLNLILPPLQVSAGSTTATLDPSGALFLNETGILVVSDLHLEKGTSWGRRGIFLPPYDTGVTLKLLAAVLERYQPASLVFLGDSFHDMGGPGRLLNEDRRILDDLTGKQDTWWIAGNHDPELSECMAGHSCEELAVGHVLFRHVPQAKSGNCFEISGHLHPVASVSGRGRSVRRRCFAMDHGRMILPAFGAYTGGLNIRDNAFSGLFDPTSFVAHVIGDKQIYSFPGLRVGQ